MTAFWKASPFMTSGLDGAARPLLLSDESPGPPVAHPAAKDMITARASFAALMEIDPAEA
jgi:hypothetical protein